MYEIMTPGPTQVRENVLAARSLPCTNPDLDPDFYTFYKETCELISSLLHTRNEALILGGEGILGLEAACAGLTEPGDRVLIIDNGVFGKGFADFVKMYGGNPVLYTVDYLEAVDVDALADFLKKDHDFKYAGNGDSQRVPAVAMMLLGDSAYGEAHKAYNHEGERSPEIPAGQQVKKTHSEGSCQGSGAASEDDSR